VRRGAWLAATIPIAALLASASGGAAFAAAASCSVGTTAFAFGTYQPLAGTSLASTATITVVCDPGLLTFVSYTIQLSAGASGQVNNRLMTGSAGGSLRYQIYADAAYSQVWGDNSGSSLEVSASYLTLPLLPSTRTFTAYGLMPGGQPAIPGTYSDAILVTVRY